MKDDAIEHYDSIFTTELATIGLQFNGRHLIKVAYLDKTTAEKCRSRFAERVKDQIQKYLQPGSGGRASGSNGIAVDIELDVTDFQGSVLKELQRIPFGETRTYGEIAARLKTSPRAVGNACRRNPLPIIIPCHRVVAASGIGGYDGARSGELLDIKRQLLAREGIEF